MAIINQQTSMHGGELPVTRRETVTFAGTDSFVYGTILARDTSTNKLVLYVKGGSTNGNGIAHCIVAEDAGIGRTGAGDVTNALVYVKGRVCREKLVIDADGTFTNIDNLVMGQLQVAGIDVFSVQEHSTANNY